MHSSPDRIESKCLSQSTKLFHNQPVLSVRAECSKTFATGKKQTSMKYLSLTAVVTLALAGLALMTFLSGADPMPLPFLISAAVSWSVAAVLGGVNHRYRSFTLVVQLAVLLVLAAMMVFMAVVGDTAAFW